MLILTFHGLAQVPLHFLNLREKGEGREGGRGEGRGKEGEQERTVAYRTNIITVSSPLLLHVV